MRRPMLYVLVPALLAAPAFAEDAGAFLNTARAMFLAVHGETCDFVFGEANTGQEVDVFTLAQASPELEEGYEVRIAEFLCSTAAYNTRSVYFLEDPFWGVVPLAFAEPVYAYETRGDDGSEELVGIETTGTGATLMLVNAELDPETGTITANDKWRGIGDMSSSGEWAIEGGRAVLKRYWVDATANGQIDPVQIVGD